MEAEVAAVDNFHLSGLSGAASGIEHGISWSDVDQQIDEHGDEYDDYYEDDVEWHTGDYDDGVEESAYTVGPPTNDPELLLKSLMATWKTLMRPLLNCMHQHVAVSRSR